jgi:8-oxo-dGTP diphosphatase
VANKLRLVVAAVMADERDRFLMARRRPGSHLEGLWEFPGGAMEEGETPAEALVREVEEELGVRVAVGEPLTFAWHRDEGRDVLLLFFSARIVSGHPHGREGQEIRWVPRAQLAALAVPPADQALLRALAQDPTRG